MQSALYDAASHRRSAVTMPGFHEGRAPETKAAGSVDPKW